MSFSPVYPKTYHINKLFTCHDFEVFWLLQINQIFIVPKIPESLRVTLFTDLGNKFILTSGRRKKK